MNYEESLHEFRRWYPSLYSQMATYKPTGRLTLAIFLNDSSIIEYDVVNHTIRDITHLKDIHTSSDIDESMWRKEFGYKLRQSMMLQGMSKDELASCVGISTQMLNRYISGNSTPSGYVLVRLSNALQCDMHELTNFDYLNQED